MNAKLATRLDQAVTRIAVEQSKETRFAAAVGLACDISLDNSVDGIEEAVDQALECLDRGADAIGIEHLVPEKCATFDLEPHYPNLPLVRLMLEIAVAQDIPARAHALQCAVTLLVQRREDAINVARAFLIMHAQGRQLH